MCVSVLVLRIYGEKGGEEMGRVEEGRWGRGMGKVGLEGLEGR